MRAPPSNLARVVGHGSMVPGLEHGIVIVLRRITPGFICGSERDVRCVLHDMNCVDGAMWDEPIDDGFRDPKYEGPSIPWRVVAASFAPISESQAREVVQDARETIDFLAANASEYADEEVREAIAEHVSVESRILDTLQSGRARDLWFAPPTLPEAVLDGPAWKFALTTLRGRLSPAPDMQLLEHRREWWLTWV